MKGEKISPSVGALVPARLNHSQCQWNEGCRIQLGIPRVATGAPPAPVIDVAHERLLCSTQRQRQ